MLIFKVLTVLFGGCFLLMFLLMLLFNPESFRYIWITARCRFLVATQLYFHGAMYFSYVPNHQNKTEKRKLLGFRAGEYKYETCLSNETNSAYSLKDYLSNVWRRISLSLCKSKQMLVRHG